MHFFGKFFTGKSLCAITLLAITAGLLHGIPWVSPALGFLAPIGIAAGLTLATARPNLSRFVLTLAWTTAAISIAFHWSPQAMAYSVSSGVWVGTAVAAPLMLWDALRMALGYFLASCFIRDLRWNWLPAAVFAIGLELWMPTVFPWKLGFMILEWPWLFQAVDLFGASWSTFILFAMAGAILNLVLLFSATRDGKSIRNSSPRNVSAMMLPAAVLLLNAIYSTWSTNHWQRVADAGTPLQVALIQVDPSFKESLANLRDRTNQVSNEVDLVCWPESSGGTYDLGLESLRDEEKVFQLSRFPERGLRPWPDPSCDLLLGGKNYIGTDEKPEKLYVAAMLIDQHERIAGRYHKQFLMPFGEYVPAEKTLPLLGQLFDMTDVITPGNQVNVLQGDSGARIGAMLCYEDMVSEVARGASHQGANVLVSLINGSAFDSPYTLWQHRMLAQLRSLETRRYFLRCAATGETCIISPLGEIQSRLPVQQDGVLIGSVQLVEDKSLFVRFPYLTPALIILSLGFIVVRSRRVRTD